MEVKTMITPYKINNEKRIVGDDRELVIESVSRDDRSVRLIFEGKSVEVLAKYLIKGISNATGNDRYS